MSIVSNLRRNDIEVLAILTNTDIYFLLFMFYIQ